MFISLCVLILVIANNCGEPACFHFASLLASGLRPISAVVTADLCSICEKINRPCGIERLIAQIEYKLDALRTWSY